jgi:outer membrane protein OmpA-like peptidoglycan-associated protein
VARDFYLQPLVEWQWGIPVNRQGYDCPSIVGASNPGEVDGEEDSCLDKEGVGAWPMTLSFGLRAVTPLRGISAFAGADFGLTGTSKFVRELAPTAPYRVLFGLSVDYDARPAAVQVVEREVQVEVAAAAPITGRVTGVVLEDGFNTPVVGAAIAIAGRELSALTTDADGRFVTYDLPPGELRFAITHPDYRDGECVATIGADGAAGETRCTLTALPKLGRIEGRVVDMWGAPLAGARVMLSGPGAFSASTDNAGHFTQADVTAGDYTARVVSETHHIKVAQVRVTARQTATLDITVAQLPAQSSIVLKPTEIQVKGNVKFARGTETIDAKASLQLAELADALLRNESLRVRIEGYFDAGSDEMQGLTRALAIRQRLIDAGVSPERLTAIGGTAKRTVFAIEQ